MQRDKDSLIGRQLNVYTIEELLGQGGMARVYRALDTKLHRYAAVKVIDPQVRNPDKYRERFSREARAIAALSHPHIVIVYSYDDVNGLYYIAMEYIEGADLSWIMKDYARDGEFMAYEVILRLIEQIATALDYAHSQGVIHRDIKPGNIMIDRSGNAKLTDFGLVLMADEGTGGEIFGSPHYIAPEQAMNSAGVVPQTDLYSLGVVLYELLTGEVPFNEGTAMQIAMGHMSEPLPDPRLIKPDLHPAFVSILKTVLAKEPKHRYQSGAELVTALQNAIQKAAGKAADTRSISSSPSLRVERRLTPRINTDSLKQASRSLAAANSIPAPYRSEGVAATRADVAATNDDEGSSLLLGLVTLLLIVIVGAVGAWTYTQEAPVVNRLPPVNAAIEGSIERIDENVIVLYGIPITIEGNELLLERLNVGDRIRLNGHYTESDDGLYFDYLASAVINEAVFQTPTPTNTPTNTPTATFTPTITLTPTQTYTPSATPTITPTGAPSATPDSSASATAVPEDSQ